MTSYSGRTASHTSVVETTLLLCKPGAQHLHRDLLQLVADANFRVQAKTFTMTPAVAEVVAATFPSVKESLHREQQQHSKLLEQHVLLLTTGGPCLAVVLSATNAVNRLLAMVGPEDPAVARRLAPGSLRAQYGGEDALHNTVHASTNLSDAGRCISAVFGYSSASLASGARTTAAVVAATATAAGEDGDAGAAGSGGAASAAVPRPDWQALQLPAAGVAPMTLAVLLRLGPEGIRLLGGQRRRGPADASPGDSSSGPATAAPSSADTGAPAARRHPTEAAAEAADGASRRQLAAEWEALARQRERLRAKEVDLFIQAAALQRTQAD